MIMYVVLYFYDSVGLASKTTLFIYEYSSKPKGKKSREGLQFIIYLIKQLHNDACDTGK